MAIRVLYVDDENTLRDIVKLSLERSGHLSVDTAASGEEALLLLKVNRYQAIISDYQMFGLDGIDLLKIVRKQFGKIPFILFTGKGREEVVVQALNNGADFYLQKGTDVRSMFAELENMLLQAVRRYEAEAAVMISEERLEMAMTASHDGLWDWDLENETLFWSAACFTMLGYQPNDLTPSYDKWVEMLHPEDRERFERRIDDYLADRTESYEMELRVRRKDGSYLWVLTRGMIVSRDESQMPRRVVGTHTDVNDRKVAELLLRESEMRFHELFDTINSGVAIYEVINDGESGSDYIIKDFNKVALSIEGLSKGDVVGKSLKELRPKIDDYGLIPIFHQVWLTGEPAYYPAKVYVDERYANWYENRVFRMPSGEIVAIYEDVTEKKVNEEALTASEARWVFALEGSNQGVWDWNIETDKVFYSKRWKEMLGYSEDEVSDDLSEWEDRVHPDDRSSIKVQMDRYFNDQTEMYRSEHRLRCKDGNYKWILDRGRVVNRSRDGHPSRMIGTHTDIDDIKQTELALRQANAKLNLLSSLTRHDLINKLMVVMGYVELLGKKPLDPDSEHYLDRMDKVLHSLHSEVRFTKDYQDLGLKEPRWQDLHLLLVEVESPVPVEIELPELSIYADQMLIKVFRNLLDNSIRHGEKVTKIKIHSYQQENQLTIVWEDDGVGIPSDQKERVFQWGVGKNMGLGLFLIRQVLSITNITIRETGEFGKGARFEISVPGEAFRFVTPAS